MNYRKSLAWLFLFYKINVFSTYFVYLHSKIFIMIIEISIGEAFDRLTILKIKSEMIKDEAKLTNVMKEYFYLQNLLKEELEVDEDNEDFKRLFNVNSQLWDVEDKLRKCEEKGDFTDEFIKLARAVYYLNDARAVIKKEINLAYGSQFVEEKSYNQL